MTNEHIVGKRRRDAPIPFRTDAFIPQSSSHLAEQRR
jgi:hypothetical protein